LTTDASFHLNDSGKVCIAAIGRLAWVREMSPHPPTRRFAVSPPPLKIRKIWMWQIRCPGSRNESRTDQRLLLLWLLHFTQRKL